MICKCDTFLHYAIILALGNPSMQHCRPEDIPRLVQPCRLPNTRASSLAQRAVVWWRPVPALRARGTAWGTESSQLVLTDALLTNSFSSWRWIQLELLGHGVSGTIFVGWFLMGLLSLSFHEKHRYVSHYQSWLFRVSQSWFCQDTRVSFSGNLINISFRYINR